MSMKRLAILAAVGHSGGTTNGTYTILGSNMTTSPGGSHAGNGNRPGPNASIHGNVNVLLGGAMLSGVILAIVFVCYCCHRNIRKNSTPYSPYWREPEVPLEVFTLATHSQCYETAGLFLPQDIDVYGIQDPRSPLPGPPPPYETVIAADEKEKELLGDGKEDKESSMVEIPLNTDEIGAGARNTLSNPFPSDHTGLPSYEAALRLEAGNYV